MDKELKEKWVKALRSGKHQQTTGALNDGKGFCCLGVLLDVSGLGNWRDEDCAYFDFNDDWNDGEMRSAEGDLGSYIRPMFAMTMEQETALVSMNDGDEKKGIRKHSFAEIADYIEANL